MLHNVLVLAHADALKTPASTVLWEKFNNPILTKCIVNRTDVPKCALQQRREPVYHLSNRDLVEQVRAPQEVELGREDRMGREEMAGVSRSCLRSMMMMCASIQILFFGPIHLYGST